jgi:hypothetical protein
MEAAQQAATGLDGRRWNLAVDQGVGIIEGRGVLNAKLTVRRMIMARHGAVARHRCEDERKCDQRSQHCVCPSEPASKCGHVRGSASLINPDADQCS